ncbi:MAG: hypothetical protein FJY92_01220 [Candidatus Hydrogenedentes bacterium]|nr:hypothetical protein [Candidatus Hydrogenedentota bacterium]
MVDGETQGEHTARRVPFAGLQPLAVPVLLVLAFGYVYTSALYFNRTSTLSPTDDSLIGVRPAEMLWTTGKLTFNPDELVEANSSFLYTLLAVPAFALFDRIGVVLYYLPFLNALFAVIGAVILFRLCTAMGAGRAWAWFAAVLMTAIPVTGFWAGSAMETSLNTLLELALVLLAVRAVNETATGKKQLCATALVTALLIMTRPDGFLVPLCTAIYLGIAKGRWRAALTVFLAMAVMFAALSAWRWWYYGQPFPNPVYAKVAGNPADLIAGAWSLWGVTFIPGALWIVISPLAVTFAIECARIVSAFATRRRADAFAGISLAPWLAFAMTAYWFVHGGDGYKERQLLTLYPLGICAWVLLAHACWSKGLREGVMVLPVLAIALFTPLTTFPSYYDFRGSDPPAFNVMKRDLNIIEAMKRDYPNTKSIAADKLGFIAYLLGPEYRVDDMLGLADVYLAHLPPKRSRSGALVHGHAKYDIEYTLNKKPGFIYMIIQTYPGLDHPYIDGLNRERLEKAGYRLAYLSSPHSFRCVDVRDAEDLDKYFRTNEYNLAVFVRTDAQ